MKTKPPAPATDDAELVRRCAIGDEAAWGALIEKYKNLIYSIPIKYGFSRDEAADIFQQVCLELLRHVGGLRNPTGIAKWLIQVTSHRCFHARDQARRQAAPEQAEDALQNATDDSAGHPLDRLAEAEREQNLREAIAALSPRCRELVRLLFFEPEPRPYNEIAAALGIATGSIGFIRGRCLDKLRGRLQEAGY